jgi:hypothetical protein
MVAIVSPKMMSRQNATEIVASAPLDKVGPPRPPADPSRRTHPGCCRDRGDKWSAVGRRKSHH